MGLQIFYSDPPQTEAEKKAAEEDKKNGKSVEDPVSMLDITNYIPSVEWSGDLDSAARKITFKIAYNTAVNDSTFQAVLLKLGGFIYANRFSAAEFSTSSATRTTILLIMSLTTI